MIPNASKAVEQQELSSVASGYVKWYSYLGRQRDSFIQNYKLLSEIG